VNPALRNQLLQLDRALLALLDERARLLREFEPASAGSAQRALRTAALDDLLRRHVDGVDAGRVRDFFSAVDRACDADAAGAEA
jgi:chorismate mutase